MRPSNKELGNELVMDANALQRVIYQYADHPVVTRLKEAARRLQLSAGLRSVRDFKFEAVKAAQSYMEGVSRERTGYSVSQSAGWIRDSIEELPLPYEEPGEFRSLSPEIKTLMNDLIDSLDYVDRTYPEGVNGVPISGIAVRKERIMAAQKFLIENLNASE